MTVTGDALEPLLQHLWEFLAVSVPPCAADVIFVFGCADRAVPARAAQLYHAGHAPQMVVSGGYGRLTRGVFDQPEAHVFKHDLVAHGVPERAIVTEPDAANTLENVRFGMAAFRDRGFRPSSALLVAKGFVMRRCVATFDRQFPDVTVYPCPLVARLQVAIDRSVPAFAARLVAEVDRLDRYTEKGHICAQQIPAGIRTTCERVTSLLSPAS